MLTSECASTLLTLGQCPVLDEGRPALLGLSVSEQLPRNARWSSDEPRQFSHAPPLHNKYNITLNISMCVHTQKQPFYGSLDFVWDNQVSRHQKKHSPTHTYPDHQTSFICFLYLLRSICIKH